MRSKKFRESSVGCGCDGMGKMRAGCWIAGCGQLSFGSVSEAAGSRLMAIRPISDVANSERTQTFVQMIIPSLTGSGLVSSLVLSKRRMERNVLDCFDSNMSECRVLIIMHASTTR